MQMQKNRRIIEADLCFPTEFEVKIEIWVQKV